MNQFPAAYWPAWNADATFLPGEKLPTAGAGRLYAVLVFVFSGSHVVLADIAGRGLCIPSGRIEPGETPAQAAEREVMEETGATLSGLRIIGAYRLVSRDPASEQALRWCPVYIAEAASFGPLPSGSESRGVFFASPPDVPRLYFTWDPLIEAVFAHAAFCCRNLPG